MPKLQSEKRYFLYVCAFIVIELMLSVGLQLTSLRLSSLLSYLSIMLCFLFALSFFRREKDYLFTLLAMFFTLIADVFLVLFIPPLRLAGMAVFVLAQGFYAVKVYILSSSKSQKIAHIVIRACLSILAVILTAIVLKDACDALAIVSMIYYANLLLNVIYAFINKKLLFAIGLVLFALCDLSIGLGVLGSGYISLSSGSFINAIIHPPFNLAWAFYLPSQVVIALSLSRKK